MSSKKYKSSYYSFGRPEMLKYIQGNNLKILEVGCGVGNFLLPIMENIQLIWGIEPDLKSSKVASENYKNVFNGKFKNFTSNEKFDYIIFNDVLEHLENPDEALLKASDMLDNNGKIVASIPNFLYFHEFRELLSTKDFRYKDSGIFDKTHLRFFTKKSISRLFQEQGLAIQTITGIHPAKSKLLSILNVIMLNQLKEFKPMQYAIVATKK